ncbi:cytochrome P450 26A1-like [Mytilus trossulus]|uniref:cytochrome P450 26A1-like n=1 Tax=Mytilus trossulus TaxID=6551 RepID=UPI003004ED1B
MTDSSILIKYNMECLIPPNCSSLTENSGVIEEFDTFTTVVFVQVALVWLIKELLIPLITPVLLTVICCHLWEVYNDCQRDSKSNLPLPPGGYGFPVFGETLGFLIQGKAFFDKRREKFGTLYKTHLLGKPTIRVIGVQNVKRILASENDLVTAQWPTSTKLLLGDGSLTGSSGNIHNLRKKALFKAFSNTALEEYTQVIQSITKDCIEHWCTQENILSHQEFKSLTFEIACRVLLGIKMNKVEKTELLGHFDTFLSNLFSLPMQIPGLGLYKGLKARTILLNKIGECIQKKEKRGSCDAFQDALSLLMDMSGTGRLSVTEIKDVGLELLFAGHETTASATVTIILQLTKNKDVVSKIKEELKSFGMSHSNYGDLNFETLNKMKYLNNVVKEAIRITPPIGGGYRKVLKTFEIDGYQIPKGWTVAYSIRDTHELGNELVLNPDEFDPDRWESLQRRDNEHFVAFGGGRRGCAGKQFALLILKIFTLEIVRSCQWTIPNINPKMKIIPVPHPAGDLPAQFTRID